MLGHKDQLIWNQVVLTSSHATALEASGDVVDLDLGIPLGREGGLLRPVVVVTAQENHPFLDGIKRTAVAAADVHLRMSGLELAGNPDDHHRFIIGLIDSGAVDWRAIEVWLRENVEAS